MRTTLINTLSRYLLFTGAALLYYAHRVLQAVESYEYVDAFDTGINPLLLPVLLGAAVCLAAGWPFLTECAERLRSQLEDRGIERDLLMVAARSDGEVSAAEIALVSGRPLSAVSSHLRVLEGRGTVNSSIDDRGATVYTVPDMLPVPCAALNRDLARTALRSDESLSMLRQP